MPSDLNRYLTFLTETLGVKTIFDFDASLSTIKLFKENFGNSESNLTIKYIFYIENLELYNEALTELLNKMILAMKINPNDYVILDEKKPTNKIADQIIYFKKSPLKNNEVYSPEILLQKPELKKKAWADMKRILQIG